MKMLYRKSLKSLCIIISAFMMIFLSSSLISEAGFLTYAARIAMTKAERIQVLDEEVTQRIVYSGVQASDTRDSMK